MLARAGAPGGVGRRCGRCREALWAVSGGASGNITAIGL